LSDGYLFCIVEDMAKRDVLGGLELQVLLALIRLGDEAYGVPIAATLAQFTGREVAVGSIYLTLDRLARKGLISSRRGEPTAVRGGRAKTYFKITPLGIKQARQARATLVGLWQGLSELEGDLR